MHIEKAEAEGACIVEGWRAGTDGRYRIETVTRTLRAVESGGATTPCTLTYPNDKTGENDRKAGDRAAV